MRKERPQACPACQPGLIKDGATPRRCILHGGDDERVQPTNASLNGFWIAERDGGRRAPTAPRETPE